MPRYKPQDRHGLLLPVGLSEQIVPGSFAFALDYLVDYELDLSALDSKFKNDEVGASAYDPRVMLKIVLLAYSQGVISSRAIERACVHNVQFIALSGDSQPSHAHIAKFVCSLRDQIKPLFTQVLMTCDAQGLIGRDLFAIDGVKLPSNASKERSGTHAELQHRARRLDQAAECQGHGDQDQRHRPPKRQDGHQQRVIQGYAAQAAVDAAHQVIVAADVIGSGSEQSMLLPLVEQSWPLANAQTLYTADAGYHSDANCCSALLMLIGALIVLMWIF